MNRLIWIAAASAAALMMVDAQQPPDLTGHVVNAGQLPVIAVPDLLGAGSAQSSMAAFNQTLWNDLDGSGILRMVPKTQYPTTVPQQLADFKIPPPAEPAPAPAGGRPRRQCDSPLAR